MRRLLLFVLACMAVAGLAGAQGFDNSANASLSGAYYFRNVAYFGSSAGNGSLARAIAAYGTMTFDGNGAYSVAGSYFDSSGSAAPVAYRIAGTYAVSSSGLLYISSPISNGDAVFGLFSTGIVVASATESGFNDLFVAVPASPQATNATFSGAYSIAGMDFPSGLPTFTRDVVLQLSADGQGNAGSPNATGYIGGNSAAANQALSGVTYSFTNGIGNLNVGGSSSSPLIAGNKVLYITPDGKFLVAGSATGFDMLVGVRVTAGSPAPALGGMYYQAGLDQDESTLGQGFATLDSYYGAFSASSGALIGHQRLFRIFDQSAFDYTYSDSLTTNFDGSLDDALLSLRYFVGEGGAIVIALGKGPSLGISVALQAPNFNASGVFILPNGVVNAASSAPFTVGVSRGELITIYGAGLAPNFVIASNIPFPTNLGGVRVLINGREAPIYYVSSNQVSVIVPYGTELTFAQIQVINNGVSSNTVTAFVNLTTPGIFTKPEGGLGRAAALHSDFTAITPASPARPGETISIFVTGLGDVSPAVVEGSAGPSNPLSNATGLFAVYIGGLKGTIGYAGLAPQLAGLYQINVTVPLGVSGGDHFIDIAGPDSFTSEATIPIAATAGAGEGTAADRPVRERRRPPVPMGNSRAPSVRRSIPELIRRQN